MISKRAMLLFALILFSLFTEVGITRAAGTDFPKVPNIPCSLDVDKLLLQEGLSRSEVACAESIIPGFTGQQIIIFKHHPVSIRIQVGILAKTKLDIAYITGESYCGFDILLDGKKIGTAPAQNGSAAVAVATCDIPRSGYVDLLPHNNKTLAFYFVSPRLPDFIRLKPDQWRKTGDNEYECCFFNIVPFTRPVIRIKSPCGFLLKANDKVVCSTKKAGTHLIYNNLPATRLVCFSLQLDGKASLNDIEIATTPLNGGQIAATKPEFLINKAPLDAWPRKELSNGIIKAIVALPDEEKGFYRSQRFEPAGIVTSLKFAGHEFMSPNYSGERDPLEVDQIAGLTEEFWDVLGYGESDTNGEFLKIGNGVYKGTDLHHYFFGWQYWPVKTLPWSSKEIERGLEFTQEVKKWNGWGYRYSKTITLTPGKSELVIHHTLTNTGKKRITSSHYNHNFILIDRLPPSPDYSVTFGYKPRLTNARKIAKRVTSSGNTVHYKSSKTTYTPVYGCPGKEKNHFTIQHSPTKLSVKITESHAPHVVGLFSCKNGICPESFTLIDIAPGESCTWTRSYHFRKE